MAASRRVLALCGGVGGAKLALGLSHILPGQELSIVVNTGDDFDHLGLRICPDLDTVTYTLGGIVNPETGWGRAGESGNFMGSLSALGGEDWFYLGDKDLALHVERTRRLSEGENLDEIISTIATRLGIAPQILPMSNDSVATMVETSSGTLAFQHYFVRDRCEPEVSGFRFAGIESAEAHPELLAALRSDDLGLVIICPSNPFVSVDPILALPEVRQGLQETAAVVLAVSPIVDGTAVKGPTAKMMRELNLPVTSTTVVQHYADFLDGFILDCRDETDMSEIEAIVEHVKVADTLMIKLDDKIALAREVLAFGNTCQQNNSRA